MNKALEIEIKKLNHSTIEVKIIHQCEEKIARGHFEFMAPSGIRFSSRNYPQIDMADNYLFLRGSHTSRDDLACRQSFSNSQRCSEYIMKLSRSVDELNQQLGG